MHIFGKNIIDCCFFCYSGHYHVVELLLKAGADVNSMRPDGITPIYVSSFHGEKEIVRLLLEHKANPNAALIQSHSTPVFSASQNGFKEIIELLVQYGADVCVFFSFSQCSN